MTESMPDKGCCAVSPRRVVSGLLRALLGTCPPQPPRQPRIPGYLWNRHSALLFDR